MTNKTANRGPILQWVVVLGVGVLVAAVVLSLQLIPRLDAGQEVLDGARPAFTTPRINADVAGIDFVSTDVNMADPIMTPSGGAAAEVPKLVAFVSAETGLTEAQVLAALQESFPHVTGLLQALPLSAVSAELPELTAFLEEALGVTPEQLTAALEANFPALTQAITNLPAVTAGWNDVPDVEGATNFAGETIKTAPQVRDYFGEDVIPVLETQQGNYDELTSISKIGFIGWLVFAVGIVVILYGLIMVVLATGWPARKRRAGVSPEAPGAPA